MSSTSNTNANTYEQLTTLFALGREVASVLDLDELLHKIPQLIARLTKFQAFAVYLLNPKREELSIAYSVGYPEEVARDLRLKVGHGLVGFPVGPRRAADLSVNGCTVRKLAAPPGYQAAVAVAGICQLTPRRAAG